MKNITLKNTVLLLLVLYSVFHFVSSSGILKPNDALGGDFKAAFPTFWAWKINPQIIKEAPQVRNWMGQEYLTLTEQVCTIPVGRLKVPTVCKKLYFENGGSPTNPITVKNQSWLYGPVLHFATFPLLFIHHFPTALRVWHTELLIFFFCTIFIWYQMLFVDRQMHSLFNLSFLFVIWANATATLDGLLGTEIEVFQLFLISLGFYALRNHKESRAGLLIGTAAMAKYLPIGLIPYLFLKKKYKAFLTGGVVLIVIYFIADYLLGWDWSFTMRLVLPFGDASTSGHSQALSSWIHRLYVPLDLFNDPSHHLFEPPVTNREAAIRTTRIVVGSIAIFYGLLFLKNWKKPILDLEVAILFILMVNLVQWNQRYYFIVLLVSYSVAFSYIAAQFTEKRSYPFSQITLLVFSYFLTGLFLPATIYKKIFSLFGLRFWETYESQSLPCYGYLILLAWLTVQYWKGRGKPLLVNEA